MVAEIRLSQVDSCRDGALGVGGGFEVTPQPYSPIIFISTRTAPTHRNKVPGLAKGARGWLHAKRIKTTRANLPSDPHQKNFQSPSGCPTGFVRLLAKWSPKSYTLSSRRCSASARRTTPNGLPNRNLNSDFDRVALYPPSRMKNDLIHNPRFKI